MALRVGQWPLLMTAMFAVGLAVHSGYPGMMWLSVVAPSVIMMQRTRTRSFFVACVYEIGVVWAMPEAVVGFFGKSLTWGVIAALTAAILLSVPCLALWGTRYKWLRAVAGVIFSAIPPLGVIDFGSPFNSAGWLFPSTGVVGLVLVLATVSLICKARAMVQRPQLLLAPIAVMAAVALHAKATPHSGQWAGVVLHAARAIGPIETFAQEESAQQSIRESTARYTVLPEGAAQEWSAISEVEWSPTLTILNAQRRFAVIGTYQLSEGRFHNEAILRGNGNVTQFEQRIPVPVAMWHPFQNGGFPLRLLAPGSITIGRERAGLLMCYEMLIPWPAIITLSERPTHLVGMANDWWAVNTPSIPRTQQASLQSWARLMTVEPTWAANLPEGVTL